MLGTRYDYSLNTSLDNISPHFVNAVIASEDHRYFEHGVTYKLVKFAQAGLLCVAARVGSLSASSPFSISSNADPMISSSRRPAGVAASGEPGAAAAKP